MRLARLAAATAAALPCVLFAGAAHAAPAWTWDAPRTYQLEARLQLPWMPWIEPVKGSQFRVGGAEVDLVVTCAPVGEGMALRCPVDAARIASIPLRAEDTERAAEIARMEASWLTEAVVEIDLGADGRIRDYDLVFPESANPRVRRAQSRLTSWVRPAVGGLDLRLADGASWDDPTTELLRLPYDAGGSSRARIRTTATPGPDGLLLRTQGTGLTSVMAMTWSFQAEFWSEARFDPAEGALASRSWGLAAVRTAASDTGAPSAATTYLAWGSVARIEGATPTLAASGAKPTEGAPAQLVDALSDAGATVPARTAKVVDHPDAGIWLGAAAGADVRGDQGVGPLLDLSVGLRLRFGPWFEAAGGYGTGGDPAAAVGDIEQSGGSLRAEAGWWGDQVVAPYAAGFALLDIRNYGTPVDTLGVVPAIGPALGLRITPSPRTSMGLTWRGAIDLREVRVEQQIDGAREELSRFGNRFQASFRWRL